MRRPAFLFYVSDWRSNANLRRCTHAERGLWIDLLCLLHDGEEYGLLRWPLREIAQALACKAVELRALVVKGVLKGADMGERARAYVYTPRHAGKDGSPATLIPEQDGPLWYSSRMVRDEYIRTKRGEGTRFGDEPKDASNLAPKPPLGDEPKPPFGDGPSVAFAFAVAKPQKIPTPNGVGVDSLAAGRATVPPCPQKKLVALYHELMPVNPKIREWTKEREGLLRARWREKALPNGVTQGYATEEAGLAWWRNFFETCSRSEFLTGKVQGRDGQPPFVADLEWLVRPAHFARVLENKYHRDLQ